MMAECASSPVFNLIPLRLWYLDRCRRRSRNHVGTRGRKQREDDKGRS